MWDSMKILVMDCHKLYYPFGAKVVLISNNKSNNNSFNHLLSLVNTPVNSFYHQLSLFMYISHFRFLSLSQQVFVF